MRRGQSNQWPGLPAPPGGWRISQTSRSRVGHGLAAAWLLIALTGCGGGSTESEATVPPCTDSQCLTPTPDPGNATTEPMPAPPVLSSTPSPVAAATSGTGTPDPNATPPGNQLAFQSELAGLGPVEWATEIDPETHEPRQRVESFATDAPVIYAVLAVDHVTAGTTIQAEWTYNRTSLESFDQVVVVESPASNTWLEFHLALTQPGAWPSGQYEITILVNGTPAVTGSVEVVAGP